MLRVLSLIDWVFDDDAIWEEKPLRGEGLEGLQCEELAHGSTIIGICRLHNSTNRGKRLILWSNSKKSAVQERGKNKKIVSHSVSLIMLEPGTY